MYEYPHAELYYHIYVTNVIHFEQKLTDTRNLLYRFSLRLWTLKYSVLDFAFDLSL